MAMTSAKKFVLLMLGAFILVALMISFNVDSLPTFSMIFTLNSSVSSERNSSRLLSLINIASKIILSTFVPSSNASVKIESITVPTTIPINESLINSANYLTSQDLGSAGLGNHMFQYATLLGLAKLLNLEPVYLATEHRSLEDVFDLKIRKIDKSVKWTEFLEECISCYTPKRYLNLQRNMSWRLTGFLQSYRYFRGIRDEIVSQFAFKNKTIAESIMRRSQIVDEFCPNTTVTNCILIGVHIRRGDYLFPGSIEFGFVVADEGYIVKAVQWYQQNFANFTRVFVVLGNDYDWNNNTFGKFVNDTFVVLKPTTAYGDMCLLSLTDHTIMTVGTYGFWAAYLTGGKVTYLKDFVRKGSSFAAAMREKFYPPEWIGL